MEGPASHESHVRLQVSVRVGYLCLGSFRGFPSVLPDSFELHQHGVDDDMVTRLGGRQTSPAAAVGLPPGYRFTTVPPPLAPHFPPSPTADRYVGRQMIHPRHKHKFHSTYKPDSSSTNSDDDDGSIQPAAPPLGSSQLLHLGNPFLELDILALLVAVSFVLSFPSAPVHPSQRQRSEDARPGISTVCRRCRSGIC